MKNIKVTENITRGNLKSTCLLMETCSNELAQMSYKLEGVQSAGGMVYELRHTQRLMDEALEKLQRLCEFKHRVFMEIESLDQTLSRGLKNGYISQEKVNSLQGIRPLINHINVPIGIGISADRINWIRKVKSEKIKAMSSTIPILSNGGPLYFRKDDLNGAQDVLNTVGQVQVENTSLQTALNWIGSISNADPLSVTYKSIKKAITKFPKCYDLPAVFKENPELAALLPVSILSN